MAGSHCFLDSLTFQCAGLIPLPVASDPQAEHSVGQEKLGSTIWGAQKSASADPGSLHPFLHLFCLPLGSVLLTVTPHGVWPTEFQTPGSQVSHQGE